jgi:hypothetical protein
MSVDWGLEKSRTKKKKEKEKEKEKIDVYLEQRRRKLDVGVAPTSDTILRPQWHNEWKY